MGRAARTATWPVRVLTPLTHDDGPPAPLTPAGSHALEQAVIDDGSDSTTCDRGLRMREIPRVHLVSRVSSLVPGP